MRFGPPRDIAEFADFASWEDASGENGLGGGGVTRSIVGGVWGLTVFSGGILTLDWCTATFSREYALYFTIQYFTLLGEGTELHLYRACFWMYCT